MTLPVRPLWWRPAGLVATCLVFLASPDANAESVPAEVVSVTPPICDQLPETGFTVCTSVVEIEIRFPSGIPATRLVQCLLRSEEQQVLGAGEALLSPPGGSLWVLLRPRYGRVALHTDTECLLKPPDRWEVP